jgi:5-hydroxyisourate hydrolase-like protein (transthyretin family)
VAHYESDMNITGRLAVGFVLAVFVYGAAAAPQQPTPSADTPSSAVSGLVLDAATGQPIAGAVVALSRLTQNATLPPRFATDSKGRFIFANLESADDYVLSARAIGYLAGAYGDPRPSEFIFFDTAVRIRLTPGQWVPDLAIRLWKMSSVSGRVMDERGEPVVGAAVQAFSKVAVAGHQRVVGGPLAVTDDRGVYVLTPLSPGSYVIGVLSVQSTVLATADEGPPARALGALQTGPIGGERGSSVRSPLVDVDRRHRLAVTNFATPPPPSLDQPRAYAAQFYPGVRSWTDAQSIDLTYGQEHAGIDFRLSPEPAFNVSGHTAGVSAPGLLLRLMPAGSEGLGVGAEAATTVVEADGSFTFLNVPAGAYTLIAQSAVTDLTTGSASIRLPSAPGFPGGGSGVGSWDGVPDVSYLMRFGAGASAWGRAAVMVAGQDVDGLVLTLRPLAQISGRIAFDTGTAPPGNSARILLGIEPANGDPLLTLPGARSAAPVEDTYLFSMDAVNGVYLITSASGYRIVSVVAVGRDVTDTGIDAATAGVEDVVITVTGRKYAELTGTVTGGSDAPTAALAFPVDEARWTDYGWTARRFRTARLRPDGTFTLSRLPPGEYFVAAIDAADSDHWTDRKFLEAVRPSATRITLGWDETRTVNLIRQGGGK